MKFITKRKRLAEFAKKPAGMATLILVGIVLWVMTGVLSGGDEANGTTAADSEEKLFLVNVEHIVADDYVDQVQVRGRTEALRTVELKAEEAGRVIATPIEKGEHVNKGDLICQIAANDREANLAQAKALAAEKQLQYNANLELKKDGFRSDTQVAAAKAELDSANAQVRRAEVALANTRIRASFDGLLNDRLVEVGDFLQVGNTCAVMLTEDPYLVVGEVSDRQVVELKPGGPATVVLTDGTRIEGKIRYVSKAARVETRTYRVEVEVPNTDGSLREGMTANINIPAGNVKAHFLPTSVLVLRDDGSVGIRAVETDNMVKFYPVEIIGNQVDGMWVKGLPSEMDLIVTGQNFVREGEEVKVSLVGNKGDAS